MGKLKSNQCGFSVIEVILVLVIIVLIGGVGWLVYKNHHKSTTTPVTATSTTKSTTSTSTKTTTSTPATTSTTTSTTTFFKIPELSIEITVPNTIKDVVYKVNSDTTLSTGQQTQSVTLSTQTLTNLDSDCSVNGSAPPLGTIFKTAGQYPANPDVDLNNASGSLLKQFSSFYIAWNSPQAACGTSTSTQSEALADTNLFKTALQTIQSITQ